MDGKSLPLVIRSVVKNADPLAWAKQNRDFVEDKLKQWGAILFRGFRNSTVEQFEAFSEWFSPDGLIDYTFRSSPRRNLGGRVYSSTEYPPHRSIPLHNEMSYTRVWPLRMWFCCIQSATSGGATPIADSARVFDRIDPAIRTKFMKHGVMYVRNFHKGIDLSFQEVFGSDDRNEIERFCDEQGIECEFGENGSLRTKQKCHATFVHPGTGRNVWFNQAHLFHVSSLEPKQAATLVSMFGKDGIPRDCYYGDGTAIDAADLDAIREAYRQEAVTFPWNNGDILMIDNVQVAHGREPIVGDRKVVVTMADKYEAGPIQH
jgi:alpha-ketoglutarate-dependent taurine dioxygenase